MRETLQYLYWWKIDGNGRNFGGKDSVALTLNTVNDEAMFNGVAYHSPEEYWPITIFYGKDTRLNLELNLGDPHKEGSLNKWIQTMQENGHKIYLSSDSKFSDNILGVVWTQQVMIHLLYTTMKQNKPEVRWASRQVCVPNYAEELKESTLNLYCHHFQQHTTFLMAITVSAD